MNSENTCCKTPASETTVVTRKDAPTAFVQPEWNAHKHDGGVDLEVTLPGVRKEDVDIEVGGAYLRLDARRSKADEPGRRVHGSATPDGYRLKLRLGDSLDGSALSAKLSDGVLKVAVPLVETARPRKIEVR